MNTASGLCGTPRKMEIKHSVWESQKGEEKEKGVEKLFQEMLAENTPNLMKCMTI